MPDRNELIIADGLARLYHASSLALVAIILRATAADRALPDAPLKFGCYDETLAEPTIAR